MRISTLKTAAVLLCMGATAGAAAQIMAPAQITPDMVDTRHFSPQTAEEFVPVNTEYLVNTDAFGMARTSTRETGAEFQFALQPGANYAILFKCLSTAEEVTIPDGTVKIAPYALSNSTKVKKINLPESLKEIGNFAFRSCNLQDITLGKTLTNGLRRVPGQCKFQRYQPRCRQHGFHRFQRHVGAQGIQDSRCRNGQHQRAQRTGRCGDDCSLSALCKQKHHQIRRSAKHQDCG